MIRPSVLLLDVGGVLLLPVAERIAAGLAKWGAAPSGHDDAGVHYSAVAAFDRTGDIHDYRRHYAERLGVPEHLTDEAAGSPAFAGPWEAVIPGAVNSLRRLVDGGFRLVVVSDSDGTIADQLGKAGVAQVGAGPGAALEAACDSTFVGVRKPDARMFCAGLRAVGANPAEALMIGDSVRCDIAGALALGIRALHVTPHSGCECTADGHVSAMTQATDLLLGGSLG